MKARALIVVTGVFLHLGTTVCQASLPDMSKQYQQLRRHVQRLEQDYHGWRELVESREIIFLPKDGRPVPVHIDRAVEILRQAHMTSATDNPGKVDPLRLVRSAAEYSRKTKSLCRQWLLPALKREILQARARMDDLARQAGLDTSRPTGRTYPA